MTQEVGFYRIQGFETDCQPNQHGFSIFLRGDIARELHTIPRPKDYQTWLGNQLAGMLPREDRGLCSVEFHAKSVLLYQIKLGAQCACFFLEPSSFELNGKYTRAVKYASHNIDTTEQAAAALGLWLSWFNSVITVTGLGQPLCI
jgi:hypothetical protein